jgi:Holliday junction resolvase RusA-like endonuclease
VRRFEFIVPGPPISAQAKAARLREWKVTVRAVARSKWGRRGRTIPVTVKVKLRVVYYHDADDVRIDEDNMLKPIQDALNGLVYEDDNLVTDGAAYKRHLRGPLVVPDLTSVALAGFRTKREFLHVIVERAPDATKPVK